MSTAPAVASAPIIAVKVRVHPSRVTFTRCGLLFEKGQEQLVKREDLTPEQFEYLLASRKSELLLEPVLGVVEAPKGEPKK